MENLVEYQTKKLRETNDFIVEALSAVIEYRNTETGNHIRRIRRLTRILLEEVACSCPEYGLTPKMVETIVSASAMHDIGKIGIPDSILLKPGRLTREEFEVMKTHTAIGCDILTTFMYMQDNEYIGFCYDICRYHHERWDGAGYPEGLAGDKIPIWAQAVGLADAYDALTNLRVYKPAIEHEVAVEMIVHGDCGVFSDQLLQCFHMIKDKYCGIREAYQDGKDVEAAPPLTSNEEYTLLEPPDSDDALVFEEASEGIRKETLEKDALVNAIPGGVVKITVDDDLRILLASQGFYNLCGYSQKEFSDSPMENKGINLILEEDIPQLEMVLSEQISKGLTICLDFRIRKKDGSIAWISLHGSQVEMEHGTAIIQAVLIDRTDSYRTEKKLLSLINTVPGGIAQVKFDESVTLLYASDGFHQLSGFTKEECQERFGGCIISAILHPEHKDRFMQQVQRINRVKPHEITMECCIVRKNGESAWCLIHGVKADEVEIPDSYQCVFTDITELKHAQELILVNEERYRIILEQIQDVIFEWDMRKDTMYHSPAFERKFGYPMPVEHFFDIACSTDLIWEEDKKTFCDFRDRLIQGQTYIQKEYRIKTKDGGYLWCRIKASVICDSKDVPLRAIGILSDVDDYKKENAQLEIKAQKDLLTGLYNKITSEGLIEEYINGCGKNKSGALMIIDIDNFKLVNDTLGHQAGDEVLRSLGALMKANFRDDDVVGRAGGDEFIIFMKDVPDDVFAQEKAGGLIRKFRQFIQIDKAGRDVSCSIGIAACPRDGRSFKELYVKADKALYQSKQSGKSRYTTYWED